jgi:alpha-L-fucosidase
MSKNSEAIYGTQASPTSTEPDWGRITMKTIDNKALLYLHVYDWKDGATLPIRLKNNVSSCYLLTDNSRTFKTETVEGGIEVKLTGSAPDNIASVIVLKLKEMPNALPIKPLGQDEKGLAVLSAFRAQYENLQGPGALYNEEWDCISNWDSETARAYWTFQIDKPGNFDVVLGYSFTEENTEIKVEFNGETKTVKLHKTGGNPKRFKTMDLGSFKTEKAGKYEFSVMPVAGKWSAINLKDVKLKPSKK